MSELALWVIELRAAIDAQWAEPLPCSGLQAMNRATRVILAKQAVFALFTTN